VRFQDHVLRIVLRNARIHVSALAARFELDPASIELDGTLLEADGNGYRYAKQWTGLTVALLLTLKRLPSQPRSIGPVADYLQRSGTKEDPAQLTGRVLAGAFEQ
jgi:hypothetical protein